MNTKWTTVRLAELIHQDRETAGAFDGNGLPVYGVTNVEGVTQTGIKTSKDRSKYLRLKPGCFVYNPYRVNVGSLGLSSKKEEGIVSPAYVVFSTTENIDSHFLYYFLKSATGNQLINFYGNRGSVRGALRFDDLCQIEIPLPPLSEQQRIVARIEDLGAQISEARNLYHQTTQEVEVLHLQQLNANITPYNEGWKREKLADVITSMDAGWSPQCDDVSSGEGEWGVLKTTAVQWCNFQPQHNKALPQGLVPLPELAVKEGDVLVTRAGPRKRVGVVAAVRRDEPRLTISDKLIRLRTSRRKITPRFLEMSLSSTFSQEHLIQRKTGLADAQVNISQAILRATPVAYPSLLEQQRIIAVQDRLQAAMDELACLKAEIGAKLDALLPAILDRAFKGEL
jgi:type I restriction enzyme S subunit